MNEPYLPRIEHTVPTSTEARLTALEELVNKLNTCPQCSGSGEVVVSGFGKEECRLCEGSGKKHV